MTTPVIEQSYSVEDVCLAWGLSPDRVRLLMRTGAIGYIKAGRGRRLLAEHVAQLRKLIEVSPVEQPTRITTRRSVPRRTRRSA
jgi:hypothetical protein